MRNGVDVVIDLRTGGDWSLDLCFAGLVRNLGEGNVYDFPYRDKHREWFDVIEGKRQPDWGLERRTLGFSTMYDDRRENIPGTDAVGVEILLRTKQARRVWLDERMESFQAYRKMGFYDANVPVVVVAGHDLFWNHSPEFVAALYGSRLEGMLLDNWYDRYGSLPFKVKRIGWSCNFDHYWERPVIAPEKDIDISFVGYNSHPDRARFIDHIERAWPSLRKHIVLERTPDSFGQFISKREYFDVIQRSKICLNLRGAADRGKTMRAYEIPYVGSCMLSQVVDDPGMMEDFKPGHHAFYFRNEDELDDMIALLLSERGAADRESVAEAGHSRAIGDLSVKSRWADVLRWLEG